MTEQLYRIERRVAKAGETAVSLYAFKEDSLIEHNVLVPVESPTPGTLVWARATVAAGGAVWNEHDELGATVKYAFPSYHEIRYPEDGYHLWGDRDWLAALPDGTRVVHDADGAWVKRDGVWLVRSVGGVEISQPIQHATDSGWDLDRSPDSARDVVELRDQPVPDAFEWRNAANRWREQVEELERRVGALEGKA